MQRAIAISSIAIALGAVALTIVGCESEPEPARVEMRNETNWYSVEVVPDAGNDFVPPFAPFAIAIDQSVTVGAFVLELGAARVTPAETRFAPYASVRIDFAAHNASESLAEPLAELYGDGLLLEVAGQYFYGIVSAKAVPGLKDGVGALSWTIDDETGLNESDLRIGTITLGQADQNKVVVPFSDPSACVTLADTPLDALFSIEDYRTSTLQVTDMRVQYNSRGSNLPLPAGTAWLVLDAVLSADPGLSRNGEYWGEENVFLERPDGVSVAPNRLNLDLQPTAREDIQLIFELTAPVAGTYTFGLTGRDEPTVTREIVIP